MAQGRLVIGNKRYSSWSLRGWLAVRLADLDVEEVVIPLAGGGFAAAWVSDGGPGDTGMPGGFEGGDAYTRAYSATGVAASRST